MKRKSYYQSTIKTNGFSLIETLVVLSLISIVMSAGLGMIQFISKERAKANFITTVQMTRDKVYSLIENGDSWNETIVQTTALSCLQPGSSTPCNHGIEVTPILRNQVGTAIFDSATQGFDSQGGICSLSDGNNCPIRYNILTRLSCGTEASCLKPAVLTSAELSIPSTAINFPINVKKYSFDVSQGRRAPSSTLFTPPYSKDCNNWETLGWETKNTCIQDGRWHLVFKNNSSGSAIMGTVNDLELHIQSGASIKVIHQSANGDCQQAYRSTLGSRPIYCLTSLRFSGEAPPFITNSSARYGTDGSAWCNAIGAPNSNGCTGLFLDYDWYVRY